jgi:hypothetical protein
MRLIVNSVDLGMTSMTWFMETLYAKFCQFDSVTMFADSAAASGTYNSVVTPILLSAHVRLTVTPCNTLPHQHATKKKKNSSFVSPSHMEQAQFGVQASAQGRPDFLVTSGFEYPRL